MKGRVILVGAGPGDPGLLTLRGRQALESAEVIVHDRLVSSVILDMIPPEAERIDVGKEAASHPVPQEEINQILVKKALEGKRVVRLKGGDPFLFGRGGEELEELCRHEIDFEVVPGVTSALAVPAYGGIPVTHRDYCSSLHIITGHAKLGKELDIDFEALVRTGGTLVFLMGVSSLCQICNGLREAGMDPDTPAAIIEQGTTPGQRTVISTVLELPGAARKADIKSPAISIVGEVCKLSDSFNWFERLPLKGRRIVVTRPRDRSGTLSRKLRELGAEVLEYPCIETVPIDPCPGLEAALSNMINYEWLIFTSAAGVDAVMGALQKMKKDSRAFGGIKLAAIGGGTAAELKKFGLVPDYIPQKYSAQSLGEGLAEIADGKILIARAEDGSPYLTEELDKAGLSYDDITVYRTFYENARSDELREDIDSGNVECVTFTSASTVRGFAASLGNDFDFSKVTGVCIGEQTAAEAGNYGIKRVVAENAAIDDMIGVILNNFRI